MLLEQFRKAKEQELEQLRKAASTHTLPRPFDGPRPDFRYALQPQNGLPAIIAEYKRASPSLGDIAPHITPEQAAQAYAKGGASALSVLTEETFFKGNLAFIPSMAKTGLPLLRKDFLFDPLQVAATLATPVSAMLLIVALTPDPTMLRDFQETATAHGITSVVEVLNYQELEIARASGAKVIQVNARNLDTLAVDRNACLALGREKQKGELWIAASGIETRLHLNEALESGYDAVLIGTSLMRDGTPETSLRRLTGRYSPEFPLSTWPNPLTKICGMKRQLDVDKAFACGADLCGFIFDARSPRFISLETAAHINTHGMFRTGVFVNAPLEVVQQAIREARLDFVQLHGDESTEYCSALPSQIVLKTVWPERFREHGNISRARLEAELERFAPYVAGFVLDSGQKGGGSGRTLDRETLCTLRTNRPCLLAGGLCPQNAASAWKEIKKLQDSPFIGLDLNSGLETAPGVKDSEKIQEMFAALETVYRFPKYRHEAQRTRNQS